MGLADRFAHSSPDAIEALVRSMPKAELHMHIEGSLEPDMIFRMAKANGAILSHPDAASLRGAYEFTDLQSFLDIYHEGTRALRTMDNFTEMAQAYLARARADNVLHAEIFFDTQTHAAHGISSNDVIDGLSRACHGAPARHGGMSASLILCFLRHLSESEAFETLEEALPKIHLLAGVGLASSEMGHPPEKFTRVFAHAKSLGLRRVAHAGEEAPASYIWQALDLLGAERIDHGVAAFSDPLLMDRLARSGIPLTICPLSNIKLKVFDSLGAHPMRAMLERGLALTLNSDDPAYFGGYINENFAQSFRALGMGAQHAYALAANSFQASFVEPARRRELLRALDAHFEQAPAS